MAELVNAINDVIWSNYLIGLCLLVGVYFSLRTRFLQVRHVKEMVTLMFEGKASANGVSSFQALTISLSGRVGTGNIAGVATAITFGGPGAVFWMWAVAFLGASTAFIESTLAQIYKEKEDGQYRGGPAYYIEKGMGQKWYAWIFAIATVIGCGLLLPGVQANSIATGVANAFGIDPTVTATIVVILLGLIIFGGIKRIAQVAEVVVPFMALGYIIVACVIVAMNLSELPQIFALIFKSAFGMEAGFGAVLGLAIQWGVKRGVYSNEAGQGTGPHPSAAAEVSHPAKQGLVQGFSVYVDTLFVCTATALMILITGTYNVKGLTAGEFLVQNLPGVDAGPGYTQAAVETVLPGFGNIFVAVALFFFAFTTIMAYYYIADTNVSYINRQVHRPWLSLLLKLVIMGSVFYGSIRSADVAWGMGDIGVGLMAWLNIIAILILQKPALLALKDYEAQKKQGLDPVFHPEKLGIKNATFWEKRVAADKASKNEPHLARFESTGR
ncbi:sodium:alanine symporter [Pokkaliibacter plantistimulans]|uniref:Sodium:alanine symporter n=1 Tax=Proteobacteria bacterium 228 TaxID=2083153 RepID=A0A2S5KTX8_9PROT|nr:alanine/glycine:cation symporter family protein [Pokkaliibacter plantistimulans]PPC78210.1 sodium:alanine symporter [Pokkaliibacter plantistimulans]